MQPVVKSENDVACGYVPSTEPMYQWVVVQGEYICEGYTKYEKLRRQVSYDGGFSWENLDEYMRGNFIQADSTDCGYIPPSEPIYRWVGTGEYICSGTPTPTPYASQYLTIESLSNNNTVYFFSQHSDNTKTISASTDDGNSWTEYTSSTGGSGTTIATLNTGGKVLLKGLNSSYGESESSSGFGNIFRSSNNFNVYGNIMSLISGDSFTNVTTFPANTKSTFFYMFSDATKLISAENLILPATTLVSNCYFSMFRGCISLTTAPELPATTMANYCYEFMFRDCTSLTTAPELPATTLANYCYYAMFYQCSSLNYIKCLATDISANGCTGYWVGSVSSTGTFVKASNVTWPTGMSGIPEGWTVQNAS